MWQELLAQRTNCHYDEEEDDLLAQTQIVSILEVDAQFQIDEQPDCPDR